MSNAAQSRCRRRKSSLSTLEPARSPRIPRVFISYRRQDASGHAGRLYDRLATEFGKAQVFRDIDTIDLGTDFTKEIDGKVAGCDALIALIGSGWLSATDSNGRRRLDDGADYVRLEIAAALERGIRVIPALVEDQPPPSPDDLPDPMKELAHRHAIQLSEDRWDYDVGRLVERLRTIDRGGTEAGGLRGAWSGHRSKVIAGVGAAAVVAAAALVLTGIVGGGGTDEGIPATGLAAVQGEAAHKAKNSVSDVSSGSPTSRVGANGHGGGAGASDTPGDDGSSLDGNLQSTTPPGAGLATDNPAKDEKKNRSGGKNPTGNTRVDDPPVLTPAQSKLSRRLPNGSSCKGIDTEFGSSVALQCSVSGAVLFLDEFENEEDVTRTQKSQAPDLAEGNGCGRSTWNVTLAWPVTSTEPRGQLSCYTTESGGVEMLWSDTDWSTVGWIGRTDHDRSALVRAWKKVVGADIRREASKLPAGSESTATPVP